MKLIEKFNGKKYIVEIHHRNSNGYDIYTVVPKKVINKYPYPINGMIRSFNGLENARLYAHSL